MKTLAGQRPPLSCRTSPPHGGRLRCHLRWRQPRTLQGKTPHRHQLISLLAGEMADRPEGTPRTSGSNTT
ncbi:hypothetical protein DUT91_13005 [Phyllobacterium salinisoli]|uniref:Propionyl-coenzyme A carboxylase alpha polypeptide n=1 Tax=Phyllobacterium salinisoli TaxID=1899321 RepID=A0A368K1G7_9HYPH|nr:hypothetical protein DUT91_13005 [Phyllobacterium salinisoli]